MEREPKQIILNLDLTECGSDKEIEMASGRRSGDPTGSTAGGSITT